MAGSGWDAVDGGLGDGFVGAPAGASGGSEEHGSRRPTLQHSTALVQTLAVRSQGALCLGGSDLG